MKRALLSMITAVLAVALIGCGDDPAAPQNAAPIMVDVTSKIFYMNVRKSCDGATGIGDFYSKVEVYRSPWGEPEELLAETDWILKQYEAGPNYPIITDLIATGTVPLVDGQRVRFVFRSYENDGGTATDIWAEGSWTYQFDASTGCWQEVGNPRPCSATDGTLDYDQNLHMYELNNGPACDVLIQGTLRIERK